MRRVMLLSTPLLALTLLAGCSQGGNNNVFKQDPGSDTHQTGADNPGPNQTTGPNEQHGSGDSCLTGSWEPADVSAFGIDQSTLDQLESVGGTFDFTMTFTNGSASIDVAINVPATRGSTAENIKITAKGSYTTSGSTLTVRNTTTTATVNGQQQSASDLGFDLTDGDVTYSCSGNTLTFDGTDFSRR